MEIIGKKISKDSEFHTLKRHVLFSTDFSFDKIRIKPNTTKVTRQISREDFQKVWNNAYKISLDEQINPVNYQKDTFHASYILAMIKSVIGNDIIDYS